MKNKERLQKHNVVILIMNIMIVVLCLLLVCTGAVVVEELQYAFSTYYNEDSMGYNVEYGSYERLVEQYYVLTAEEVKVNRNVQEYLGVGHYFKEAFFYKAYETIGDTVRAARAREEMNRVYAEMGSWNIAQEDIHERLGIE